MFKQVLFIALLVTLLVPLSAFASVAIPADSAVSLALCTIGLLALGAAIDTLSGFNTAPNVAIPGPVIGMAAGDALTIKNCPAGAFLTNLWTLTLVAGVVRIGSGRMHNILDALRFRTTVASPYPLLPYEFGQPLFSQDVLTCDLSGSAVAAAIESVIFQLYYPSLPGSEQNLLIYSDLKSRIVNLLAVEVANVPGVVGGWSGPVAINATFVRMKANVAYAFLGAVVDANVGAVAIRGADTGGLRVGCPTHLVNRQVGQGWLIDQSKALGVPFIPEINGANQAGTFLEVVNSNAVIAALNTTLIFAQLR